MINLERKQEHGKKQQISQVDFQTCLDIIVGST